jgi:hypothetical protein
MGWPAGSIPVHRRQFLEVNMTEQQIRDAIFAAAERFGIIEAAKAIIEDSLHTD